MTRIITTALSMLSAATIFAQNPIICDRYTPDPAPYVHNDTLYLFVDHDGNETQNNYFTMPDWLLYSTVDMVNWTYRGTPVKTSTFKWAKQGNDAWASQCIERNGKWYWYVTATVANGGYPGVGVAMATSPEGPYRDVMNKPLAKGWGFIDPTVFIDDDGQAYLFWGNNGLWYSKLSNNMLLLRGDPVEVKTNDEAAFGPSTKKDDKGNKKTNYEEAPWLYKIGDTYYLEYAAGGVPEHWAYSTAKDINGPWTYQGKITGLADNSFTIHGGSVNFRGHWYLFYHNGKLPGGGGYKRSTCIEEYTRGEDGSIPFVKFTNEGVKPIQTLDPYALQQGETINQSSGILCDGDGERFYVTNIHTGDYIKVRNVDFGSEEAQSFTATVRAECKATMLVRTGSKTGQIIARLPIEPTDGQWQAISVDLSPKVSGKKDLFFTFTGTVGKAATLFQLDTWQFSRQPSAITAVKADKQPDSSATYTIDGRRTDRQNPPNRGIIIRGGKKYLER